MSAEDRDPRLIWTEAGEPRSGRFGDVYFSAEDGLSETRAVFLEGCGLPGGWRSRQHFTIAELGFGSGLNIAAVLDLWRRTRPEGARLSLFSVEAYPMTHEDATRALSRWPEIAGAAEALLAGWPPPTPGFHRIDLPGFDATFDLAIGEVDWALSQWSGRADAWFLDGFAPSTNPGMWSDAVFDAVATRSAPGARIATFTVAGAVRRGLAERGFTVEKKPGHGRKRERLEARQPGPPLPAPASPRIAVVGAGIAGTSVVRALRAQGITPILVEAAGVGAGASGFPAALITPRFDLGDAPIAALFAQALERARSLYRSVPAAILAEGVAQRPGSERDLARFARIADQSIWPDGTLRMEGDELHMTEALTVQPAAILSAWLSEVETVRGEVASLSAEADGWALLDSSGAILATADTVILCAGPANADLAPGLALSPVRGQAEWTAHSPVEAQAWGGYIAPTVDGFLFGTTHDRGDTGTEIRPADTARNLETLTVRAPDLAAAIDFSTLRSRAAIRATTRDRLPLCGSVPDAPGLFVLGGLGSRGFCLSPLLGEHVAALALDRPSPLPVQVAARIDPSRKAARRLAEPGDRDNG